MTDNKMNDERTWKNTNFFERCPNVSAVFLYWQSVSTSFKKEHQNGIGTVSFIEVKLNKLNYNESKAQNTHS